MLLGLHCINSRIAVSEVKAVCLCDGRRGGECHITAGAQLELHLLVNMRPRHFWFLHIFISLVDDAYRNREGKSQQESPLWLADMNKRRHEWLCLYCRPALLIHDDSLCLSKQWQQLRSFLLFIVKYIKTINGSSWYIMVTKYTVHKQATLNNYFIISSISLPCCS